MEQPGDEDADVVERSLRDPTAFGVLFDRHAPAVHAYLGRRLGAEVAREVLNEVFHIAFERRHSYRPDRSSARPWLFGIAANVVRRHHEREMRWARGSEWSEALSATPVDVIGRTDDQLAASELRPRIAAALRSLPLADRETLLLLAWEELSYAQIAEALDVPIGTVRSRLHRARSHLRAHLGARVAADGPSVERQVESTECER